VQRILASASRLLTQIPLGEITTSRIAGDSGVSIGGLYRFFPDKQAIVDTIAAVHIQAFENEVRNRLSALGNIDGTAFLSTMIDAYISFLDERPDFRAITFGQHISKAARAQQSHPNVGVLAIVKKFLGLQHASADSESLDMKIRLATVAGERLIAFAYEQENLAQRRRVVEELKQLLAAYLF